MVFYIEVDLQKHIEGIKLIANQWAIFIKLYRESDLGTRDKAMFEISRADSTKFATIEAYTSVIKVANQTLFKMGLSLPK